jgi:hypothetical protein
MIRLGGQKIRYIPENGITIHQPGGGAGNGLLDNLIAYWPLNEAAGANDALDLHTNALTMTQVDSPGSAAGRVYAGARVTNAADYFTRNSEALLQTGATDLTIAMWIYPTATDTYQTMISKGNYLAANGYEYGFLRYHPTNNVGFYAGNAVTYATVTTGGGCTVNNWHFIVARVDRTLQKIYISIDGGAENSQVWTDAGYTNASAVLFGSNGGGGTAYRFGGRIGPIMFWKSAVGAGGALSAEQITALYNAGVGLPYASFT